MPAKIHDREDRTKSLSKLQILFVTSAQLNIENDALNKSIRLPFAMRKVDGL